MVGANGRGPGAVERFMSDYYFAYGSNLDREDWARFCARQGADPASICAVGPAVLPDCELAFNYRSAARDGGALNLAPRRGQVVHGVLFEASSEGWAALDTKEGVAAGRYRRSDRRAIVPGGAVVPVTTYEVVRERIESFVAPRPEYVDTVARGLAAHGLPTTQLDAAARGERPPAEVEGFFVYGTLMRGESRFGAIAAHGLSRVLLSRGRGWLHETAGDYPMMDLGAAADEGEVRGEYMGVTALEAAVEALDAVEDFAGYGRPDNEYVRTLVRIDTGEHRPRLAWSYVAWNRQMIGARIPSGCWREHRGVREAFFRRLAGAHQGGNTAFLRSLRAAVREFVVAQHPEPPAEPTLDAIAQALSDGRLTEHRLAQLSGRWAALAE